MIVKTMSDKEILKELKSIDVILKSRISGHLKKFEKQLKSKAYKHNDVLEVREYVINWNRVLVCFQKLVHTDKLSSLAISHIVLTEDNGAFLSFMNERGNYFFHFTKHAIDRLWERTGLTLKDFFVNEFAIKAETTYHLTKSGEYGYDDSTYIMSIGRCFFVVCTEGDKIVVKTTLDRDNLYANQMELYVDSKRGAEKFADKVYESAADIIKGRRFKKTSDVISGICA